MAMNIDKCTLKELPKIADSRGNLSVIESEQTVPFGIERVYYLYDVPGGGERGGHAHKKLEQFMISLGGSFDVVIDDGNRKRTIHLNRPYIGLYICPMIWRNLENFSSGSVCLVLASEHYEEEDYFREYSEFLASVKNV